VLLPAGIPWRVVGAEPAKLEEVVREPPLRRRLGEVGIDEPGPVRGGKCDRPPSPPLGPQPPQVPRDLAERPHRVLGHALRREVVEQARVRLSHDVRDRRTRLQMLAQDATGPVGQRAEHVVAPVADARGLDARLDVAELHECGAGAVSRLGERDRELAVVGMRVDEEGVALVEPQAAADVRVGVALAFVRLQDGVQRENGIYQRSSTVRSSGT
jgi:hypothetical protein